MFEQNTVELDMQIHKYLYFLQCQYTLQLLGPTRCTRSNEKEIVCLNFSIVNCLLPQVQKLVILK